MIWKKTIDKLPEKGKTVLICSTHMDYEIASYNPDTECWEWGFGFETYKNEFPYWCYFPELDIK